MNRVTDALSRRDESNLTDTSKSSLFVEVLKPLPDILEVLWVDVSSIPKLIALSAQIRDGTAPKELRLYDGLTYRRRQILVALTLAAKPALLYEHHSTLSAGHPGVDRTFRCIASTFYCPGLRRDVKSFVVACFECQTMKYSTQKQAGLLQQLPIPTQVWEDVSMDFLTGLPPSRGFTTIMVVVDRLSKYAHFAPLPTRFDA